MTNIFWLLIILGTSDAGKLSTEITLPLYVSQEVCEEMAGPDGICLEVRKPDATPWKAKW